MKINYIWLLVIILESLFVAGKVFGFLDWSWWLVFSPIIFLFGLILIFVICLIVWIFSLGLICLIFGGKNVRIKRHAKN